MDKHIFIIEDEGGYKQLVAGLVSKGYSVDDMSIYTEEKDVIEFPENGPIFFRLTRECFADIMNPEQGSITIIQTEKVMGSTIQEMIENALPDLREVIEVMAGKRRAQYDQSYTGAFHTYLFYTGSNPLAMQTAFHNTINELV